MPYINNTHIQLLGNINEKQQYLHIKFSIINEFIFL